MSMARNKGPRKRKGPTFVGRFERLRKHFKMHPDAALRTLYADVERMEGLHSFARTDKFTIECDEPEGLGGTDKATTPTQLLLAALAHCQAITVRIYADAMGVALDDLKVKVTGTVDLRGYFSVDENGKNVPPGLQEVVIRTEMVTHETEAKVKELLKAARGKGVSLSSVEKGTKLRYQYRVNGRGIKI